MIQFVGIERTEKIIFIFGGLDMSFCPNCGSPIENEAKFCAECGKSQDAASDQQSPAIPNAYYKVPPIASISEIYGRAFGILMKKPVRLWGLSLLAGLLICIAPIACGFIPILFVPIALTLGFGMTYILLSGYKGKDVNSAMIFSGFKNFKRVAGGMCWMYLWLFLWCLIPFAGIVMGIIKGYAYSQVPYILMTRKDVSATEALNISKEMTKGYKGKLFLAELLIGVAYTIVYLILLALTLIPIAGVIFGIILFIYLVLCVALLPLFTGLISAAFFTEIAGARNLPTEIQ
jgi:uncharacterized membrane protein